jgi:hypothetical protein
MMPIRLAARARSRQVRVVLLDFLLSGSGMSVLLRGTLSTSVENPEKWEALTSRNVFRLNRC